MWHFFGFSQVIFTIILLFFPQSLLKRYKCKYFWIPIFGLVKISWNIKWAITFAYGLNTVLLPHDHVQYTLLKNCTKTIWLFSSCLALEQGEAPVVDKIWLDGFAQFPICWICRHLPALEREQWHHMIRPTLWQIICLASFNKINLKLE